MSYKINDIEGIGTMYKAKLAEANITTTDDLLNLCCSAKGRKDIAEKTGMSASTLLKWSNQADLMRISGIGRSQPSANAAITAARPSWVRISPVKGSE